VAAFGLVFLTTGVAIVARQSRFRRRATTAQGTIVSLRSTWTTFNSPALRTSPVYRPTVRFVTGDGQSVEAEARTGTNPPAGRVGQAVVVYYDPADPSRFSTTSIARIAGCAAAAFIALGGLVLVIGVLVLAAVWP
jgi:hypothetical protein